ncbi:GPI inositol-deacylase A [Yarrowia sp. B02]|nr:GPI inositol-deacylase A [Yarrowia sp. B02]
MITFPVIAVVSLLLLVWATVSTHSNNTNGCHMSYMKPDIIHMAGFNTSQTPLAHKYSLHLYRELDVDLSREVGGFPVLFVPGNGGSMRQIRSIAGEAAVRYWSAQNETYTEADSTQTQTQTQTAQTQKQLAFDVAGGADEEEEEEDTEEEKEDVAESEKTEKTRLRNSRKSQSSGYNLPLDFFTVNFQEDLTAFDGTTVVDQAEYLNKAIAYILSLYDGHDNPPKSVILIGHSMGGIVARTMVTLESYVPDSINTILTLATPHVIPPVSFDKGIVGLYHHVNAFWKAEAVSGGKLEDTLLVSVTGGIRDQMIPAEYSAVSSFLPSSNGFAVATTSIPGVWMSIDHQAMVWCHQLRSVLAEVLLDVSDRVGLNERRKMFQKYFLSGMEQVEKSDIVEVSESGSFESSESEYSRSFKSSRASYSSSPSSRLSSPSPESSSSPSKLKLDTLLSVNTPLTTTTNIIINDHSPNQLVKTKSYFKFPVLKPSEINEMSKSFAMPVDKDKSLLVKTNMPLEDLHILVCRKNIEVDTNGFTFLRYGSVSKGVRVGSDTLVCANVASEAITMPSSIKYSTEAKIPDEDFIDSGDEIESVVALAPESNYIQIGSERLSGFDYVVVIDNTISEMLSSDSYLLAEMSYPSNMAVTALPTWWEVLKAGRFTIELPEKRALLTKISLPHFWSSLVAFSIRLSTSDSFSMEYQCEAKKSMGNEHDVLFAPLLMQYSSQLHEAKFSTDLCGGYEQGTRVAVHGGAPYVPSEDVSGTELYLWTDSSSRSSESLSLTLEIDLWGSLGRFLGFYRVMFAIFPMFVFLCLFLIQFRLWTQSEVFVSLNDALDVFVSNYLVWILAFSCLIPFVPHFFVSLLYPQMSQPGQAFLGLNGTHLWFLGPVSLVIATGIVVVLHWLLQTVTFCVCQSYTVLGLAPIAPESPFSVRRIVTISFLLLLVFKVVPHQFAFMVAVLVMTMGAGKARVGRLVEVKTDKKAVPTVVTDFNLINYTHSLLLLLVLLLPMNAPTLVVWLHNMANKWHTPLESHHEVSAILPILLLVLTASRGIMIRLPQSQKALYATMAFLAYFAVFVLFHGVVHAYRLHLLTNGLSLCLLYLSV